MGRVPAVIGSIVFLVVAPGTVAGVVPFLISRWRVQPPFLGSSLSRLPGFVLVGVGLVVLLDSFARFALQGRGTPAPILPTGQLVVTGLYRRVRNPMYVAVVSLIVGQSLLLGDPSVLRYGAVAWLAFHLFVLVYEEPTLRRTYGDEYVRYCANVRRWIPRLRAWR
jgi:protein-S-isoprenylcysteine O-methyltransferase Ste14